MPLNQPIDITPAEHLLTAKLDDTVDSVKRNLARTHPKAQFTANYVHLLDDQGILRGIISIKQIIFGSGNVQLNKIMEKNLITASPHISRQGVAHLAIRHNFKSIPIVDHQKHFLGIVASDDILRYLNHLHHQKILKTAGISPSHSQFNITSDKQSIAGSIRHRLGWIIFGLFGGFFAAGLVNSFDHVIQQNLILAAFIPLVVYISNAVGIQAQTLYIRDLVLEPKIKTLRYLIRQLIISLVIGGIAGGVIAIVISFIWHQVYMGLIIGIAAITAIFAATIVAILIPFILQRLKFDPADGGGPFATIIQDLSSITIYFLIARALI